MSDEAGNPWERQPGEYNKAYAAFCLHRDTPPTQRNLRELSIRIYGRELSHVRQWSARNHWSARVAAYDAHLDALAQVAIQEAIVQDRVDAAKDRVDASRAGVKLFKSWVDQAKPKDLPAGVMPSLFKTCAEMGRLEDEKSTQNIKHDGDGIVIYLPDNGRDPK